MLNLKMKLEDTKYKDMVPTKLGKIQISRMPQEEIENYNNDVRAAYRKINEDYSEENYTQLRFYQIYTSAGTPEQKATLPQIELAAKQALEVQIAVSACKERIIRSREEKAKLKESTRRINKKINETIRQGVRSL